MDQDAQAVKSAKQYAYRLLAYRGRTRHELCDRLQQRGYTRTVVEAVLRELELAGYIDDRKLVGDWARYRLQVKPLGRRRIAWELQRRGVDRDLLDEVLDEVYAECDEVALAEQAARKRLRTMGSPVSVRERQQLMRYLLGLGFEPDTIMAAVTAISSSMAPLDIGSNDDPG